MKKGPTGAAATYLRSPLPLTWGRNLHPVVNIATSVGLPSPTWGCHGRLPEVPLQPPLRSLMLTPWGHCFRCLLEVAALCLTWGYCHLPKVITIFGSSPLGHPPRTSLNPQDLLGSMVAQLVACLPPMKTNSDFNPTLTSTFCTCYPIRKNLNKWNSPLNISHPQKMVHHDVKSNNENYELVSMKKKHVTVNPGMKKNTRNKQLQKMPGEAPLFCEALEVYIMEASPLSRDPPRGPLIVDRSSAKKVGDPKTLSTREDYDPQMIGIVKGVGGSEVSCQPPCQQVQVRIPPPSLMFCQCYPKRRPVFTSEWQKNQDTNNITQTIFLHQWGLSSNEKKF